MENIKAITKTVETEIRRVRPNANAVAVTVDGETYHATVDGIAYTFECGSDDDELVFVNDTDETDTIVVPLPESPLDKLNELRAIAGMKPLKSWRASTAALDAAIAKLSPATPPVAQQRKASRLSTAEENPATWRRNRLPPRGSGTDAG